MERIKYLIYPFLIVAGLCVISCSKEDGFKEFTKNGEITYPGKPITVIAQAGNKRVLLRVVLGPDPAITKIKTYWNSRTDSLETPVVRSNGDTVNIFVTQRLNEGANNFELYAYNNKGDKSIVTNVSGTMFSDNYLSTVPKTNRSITSLKFSAFGKATIAWGPALTSEQFIELKYLNAKGVDTTLIAPSQSITTLPSYKLGTAITYRSIYAPEATAYDVLTVAPSTVDLTKGTYSAVTSGYLYSSTTKKLLGAAKAWVPSGTNGIIITSGDIGATTQALIVINPDNTLTITAAPGSANGPFTMYTSGLPTPYTAGWLNSAACNNTYDPVTKTYKVRYGISGTGARVIEEIIALN
ncbi:DUF4998 domain-containing protein [Pedobacter nyackensis]|uniref:DUF5013 domain-containing protein n=1 Tax=Pedobacter nyackensis TaxID=475255 RepID=A0A1W2C086_9SPHI|nr:DUF4998 domain-containing protein [Pedobacter nyackensis]SMC78667.1 protein of unknown function [Pedobacter nyackensis]